MQVHRYMEADPRSHEVECPLSPSLGEDGQWNPICLRKSDQPK